MLRTLATLAAAAAALAALAAPASGAAKPAAPAPLERVDPAAASRELVVGFRAGVGAADQRATLRGLAGRAGRPLDIPRTRVVRVPRGTSLGTAIRALERDPDVLFAERNHRYRLHGFPNDPRFPELWGLHQTGDRDIDAPEAWDLTTGDPGVVVGVIDSGVAYDHPDLAPNIWTNPGEVADNGLDDDGNGFVDDVRGWDFVQDDNTPLDALGHGTHVAGTIGARGDNALGITGVNWQVSIMPLRAGDLFSLTNAAISSAIHYACANGARVVNGSFGGPRSTAITNALSSPACAGTLFVFSAGNDRSSNDRFPVFPCNTPIPNVVCVAATNRKDEKARFSNFGRKNVDIAAPGVSVLSGVPSFEKLVEDGFENDPTPFSTRWGGQVSPPGHPVWGQSGVRRSGLFGLSDSPGANYANETDASIRSLVPLDLSARTGCVLEYAVRLNVEWDFDFFEVHAGTSFGGSYERLGEYTGSTFGEYAELVEDLSRFEGEPAVHLLFRLVSDDSVTRAGADLDELVVSCLGAPPAQGEYASHDGTSMAAPHVTGVAALMLAANPALTPRDLRKKLLRTTDARIGLALRVASGGRLNAARAVASALGPVPFVRCVVPGLRGKRLRTAKAVLVARGCRVGKITWVASAARRGRVTKQSWPAGVWLPKGTRVALRVSRGR